jgi:DNA repair ATPase RecN
VRFYQAASHKRKTDFDFHFVNADNKQTVTRITKLYKDMGVRCAGIVDFDVLNNQTEFERQLHNLGFTEEEIKQALISRTNIAKFAEEISPTDRLNYVEKQMSKMLSKLNTSEKSTPKDAEKLLRLAESKCRELADSTKSWKQLKQQGRAALPPEIQQQFDSLALMCETRGLFVNPCGELEAMLTEYGIPYTTDKRSWITQALQLLPNLEVDDNKYPWKFIERIHDHFSG